MYAEFKAAIESTRALLAIAGAARSAIDQAALAAAIGDVNSKLLDAQSAAFELQEKNAALRSEIAELKDAARKAEDWGLEAEKYEIRQLASGVFAYLEKGFVDPFEGAVKLCTTCYGQRERVMLQQEPVDYGREFILRCGRCKSVARFTHYLA